MHSRETFKRCIIVIIFLSKHVVFFVEAFIDNYKIDLMNSNILMFRQIAYYNIITFEMNLLHICMKNRIHILQKLNVLSWSFIFLLLYFFTIILSVFEVWVKAELLKLNFNRKIVESIHHIDVGFSLSKTLTFAKRKFHPEKFPLFNAKFAHTCAKRVHYFIVPYIIHGYFYKISYFAIKS